jgi:hypothetical protein
MGKSSGWKEELLVSCRPHEILKLKIKDIAFKTTGKRLSGS